MNQTKEQYAALNGLSKMYDHFNSKQELGHVAEVLKLLSPKQAQEAADIFVQGYLEVFE